MSPLLRRIPPLHTPPLVPSSAPRHAVSNLRRSLSTVPLHHHAKPLATFRAYTFSTNRAYAHQPFSATAAAATNCTTLMLCSMCRHLRTLHFRFSSSHQHAHRRASQLSRRRPPGGTPRVPILLPSPAVLPLPRLRLCRLRPRLLHLTLTAPRSTGRCHVQCSRAARRRAEG